MNKKRCYFSLFTLGMRAQKRSKGNSGEPFADGITRVSRARKIK